MSCSKANTAAATTKNHFNFLFNRVFPYPNNAPTKFPSLSVQSAKKQKPAPSYEVIASKAYEIWLSKGQQPGCDQKNWFEAEAQLQAL